MDNKEKICQLSSIIRGACLSSLEIKKSHGLIHTVKQKMGQILGFRAKEKGIDLREGNSHHTLTLVFLYHVTAFVALHVITCSLVSLLDCQLLESREHTLLSLSYPCLAQCLKFTRYLINVC